MASLPKGLSAVLAKAPTDTVILSSLRTPICRSYKGQLKDAYPEELLASVLRATLAANPNLDPAQINDVAVGVVLSELGGSKAARMAMNHVGYPSTTSLYTVNRACSSSLQAIAAVAGQIRVGAADVGIGAGMESMTRNYGSRAIPVDLWPELKESPNQEARDCIMPMGLTSENVASRYGVSRADQDAFAVESHLRAAKARESGAFADEIVPVETRFQEVDKQGNKVGEEKRITAKEDDGIRANATVEGLAKLKPAFKADGASTAGNSSQVSDGAAATLLMRRSTATELGLTGNIIGKFVGAISVGCKPDEMGIGPALAIPKLLGQFGLSNGDVDRWEINEAFASQALYCVRALGLEGAMDKVNPDGGAIALGHPLGATGARMTATLLHGLKRQGGEVGVVSMCVGTGMGMADQQDLVLNGQKLEGSLTVADRKIPKGATLHIVLRLRGGGPLPPQAGDELDIAPGRVIKQDAPLFPINARTYANAGLLFFDFFEETPSDIFGVDTFAFVENVNAMETAQGLAAGQEPVVAPRTVKLCERSLATNMLSGGSLHHVEDPDGLLSPNGPCCVLRTLNIDTDSK